MDSLQSQTQLQHPRLETRLSCFPPTSSNTQSRSPRRMFNHKVKKFQKNYTVSNKLLNSFMLVSVEITSHNGFLKITPSLTFRSIVSNSPAIILIKEESQSWARAKKSGKSKEGVSRVLKKTYRKLLQLFREGKASPTDVDVKGNTALHVRSSSVFELRLQNLALVVHFVSNIFDSI